MYIFIYSSSRNTLEYSSWKRAHFLSMFCVIPATLAVLNMCSVELPGVVLTMNNVILTKWRIALSINIGVLENH